MTGHSGRRTLISAAVNSGVDTSVVALASKHRDPRSLLGYIEPNVNTTLSAAMAIGHIVSGDTKRDTIELSSSGRLKKRGRVVFDDEDEIEFSQPCSSAIESSKKPVDLTSSKVAGNVVYNFYIGQNPA